MDDFFKKTYEPIVCKLRQLTTGTLCFTPDEKHNFSVFFLRAFIHMNFYTIYRAKVGSIES